LPNKGNRRRVARGLALPVAASALAAGWLLVGAAKPAYAEFEIQESEVEKGEVELEYRGAVHWGFPKGESGEAEEEEGSGALDEEEEAPLKQSHDFEFQWGVTDRWLFSTTLSTDQPKGENFETNAVEIEVQRELIEREGNGWGLAFAVGYGIAARGGVADEIEFGPIIEYQTGKLLLTINPFFGGEVGENRETESLSFEYGWRAEYDFAKHWGVGVEMFGEVENLVDTDPFDDQEHSIGPTIFYNPGDDDEEGEEVGDAGDDEAEKKEGGGPAEMEFSLNVGVQFGLTEATSDTALKFQGGLAF
jgi:hypothetical protein